MAKKSTFVLVFLAAVALGFICEFAPWQRRNITTNDHPIVPIFCGTVLLLFAFSKLPEAKPLKPTLIIVAVSVLVVGVLVFMLDDQGFCGYVGNRIAVYLYRLKFVFSGIAIGAFLSSLFYGHWTSALLAARERQQSSAARNKRME
jgi:hypothetical protein